MTTATEAIKRVEEARLDHQGEWALRYARLDTAVRDLIAALSTPPADDVREALDLDSLEAKARAATPGPWQALTTGARGGDHWYIVDDDESIAHISANDGEDEDRREPNARYMAAASPDVVRALIERIRAAEVRPRGTVTDALYCAHCQNDDHASSACEARGTVTDAVSDELLLDSRTIHYARYGGLGGDVASVTITAEAWRRLGKPRAIQISASVSSDAVS